MVLENISPSSSGDFVDGAPASDNDPYSSNSSTPTSRNYHIDTSKFPKPIPILGPLLGFNERYYEFILRRSIEGTAQGLNRTITDDEAAALGYWTAKQISIYSWATPLGWAAAAWRWNNTSSSFRYPFFQPDMTRLDTTVFPTQKFAFLKGQAARGVWNASRLGAYGMISVPIAQALLWSYSASVGAVGSFSDPRMKSIIDSVKAKAQAQRGGLSGQAGKAGQNTQAQKSASTEVDDASPTGGMLWEEPIVAETASNPTQPTPMQTSRAKWSPKPAPIQAPASSSPQDQAFDPFDEASPTGGQGVSSDTRPAAQGSAWDRLRRGPVIKPGSSSAWQKQQDDKDPNQGAGYSISKTDEERNYAREEAQKEFDARVEQERRGGDFSKGNGDQKRW